MRNHIKLFRTTLDIDTNDKEFISHILPKILLCNHVFDYSTKLSSFKGVHIVLFCDKRCDICRIVYDDFRRLAYDSNRPEYARNILFDKEIFP